MTMTTLNIPIGKTLATMLNDNKEEIEVYVDGYVQGKYGVKAIVVNIITGELDIVTPSELTVELMS